jgi:hypothetical protein
MRLLNHFTLKLGNAFELVLMVCGLAMAVVGFAIVLS